MESDAITGNPIAQRNIKNLIQHKTAIYLSDIHCISMAILNSKIEPNLSVEKAVGFIPWKKKPYSHLCSQVNLDIFSNTLYPD